MDDGVERAVLLLLAMARSFLPSTSSLRLFLGFTGLVLVAAPSLSNRHLRVPKILTTSFPEILASCR
jgi:hypothetical protein